MRSRLIVSTVFVLALVACGKTPPPPEIPAVAVEAVTVTPKDFTLSYRGPAALEGWRVANLGTENNSRITWLGAEEGQVVREGQPLFRLDASVQSARVAEADARIADARVAADNAKANFERTQLMFSQGVASRQELDNAAAAHARSIEAVSAVRAAAGAASGDAGKLTVRAPFDGVVTIQNKEVGEVVGSNSVIVRVEDLSAIKAIVNVPEREIIGIRAGSPSTLRLAAGITCTGVVSLVSPAADAMSRAVKVEIRVDSPDSNFRSGLFAEAEIVREVRKATLLVPRAALLRGVGGVASVYVEEGGVAHKRDVTVGGSDDYLFEITAGLKPGDHVIASGVSLLTEGTRVRTTQK